MRAKPELKHLKKGSEKNVTIVTGTPGVGKTAVSRLLAERLKALHVDLGELVQRENLVCGFDAERETLVADLHKVSRRVKEILANWEGNAVVDGHYAVNVAPLNLVSFVFVLRRRPEELKKFMESRGFQGRKLWENLAAEILDVCLYEAIKACGEEKVCEIDVSGKSVEDVVEEIISVLKDKRKCRLGVVDWLGELEKKGRLEEFLKDF